MLRKVPEKAYGSPEVKCQYTPKSYSIQEHHDTRKEENPDILLQCLRKSEPGS